MKKLILLLIGLASTVQAQTFTPSSPSVLKSYFVTGAVPTQTNYDDLIDSFFYYVNQAYSNAVVAANYAQATHDSLTNYTRAMFRTPSEPSLSLWGMTNLPLIVAQNVSSISITNPAGTTAANFSVHLTVAPDGTNAPGIYFPISTMTNGVTYSLVSAHSNSFIFRVVFQPSAAGNVPVSFFVQ